MATYYSKDDETFNFDSFGELIDDLKTDYDNDELIGMTYWMAEGSSLTYKDCIDVKGFLDQCNDNAYEEVGESFDSEFDVSTEAQDELMKLLEIWAAKHVKLNYWKLEGKSTKGIITAEDLA